MSGLPPGKAAGLGAGDRAGQSVTGSVVVGDVIQLANVSGSVGVTLTRPLYRVEGLAAVRGGLSVDRARAQPSLLLSARYEVVPFTGRVNLLQELADWLCEETSPVSVRLVYGPGGQGKSRVGSVASAAGAAVFRCAKAHRYPRWRRWAAGDSGLRRTLGAVPPSGLD